MNNPPAHAIDSKLELFLDKHLLESLDEGASLRLHQPTPRDDAFATDKPWEGNMCGYFTVIQDGDRYLMYYRTGHCVLENTENQPDHFVITVAVALSDDGIHWERPNLGLFEHNGSKQNNIVWIGEGELLKGVHGFAPFIDQSEPQGSPTRFKALGAARGAFGNGLFAMSSPDGIHWSLLQEDPVLDGSVAHFDSQNLAFWDEGADLYRIYFRNYVGGTFFEGGQRGVDTATSKDFIHWSKNKPLNWVNSPDEQLYTNQVIPYYRAPHIFLGFPSRYIERPWSPSIEALPELEHRKIRAAVNPRYGSAITDGLFMSSRDGSTFNRWPEAFIRPGPQLEGNWTYGDNYQCWGMFETPSSIPGAPPEISFYVSENYWRGEATLLRRYTIRQDGFVSLHAPLSGGEIVTKPFTFKGEKLQLNLSTSAAGSVQVEIQDIAGTPLGGYNLEQCHEIIGDEIERVVTWEQGSDVSSLADQPIRLRFVLKDADLYAMRFS